MIRHGARVGAAGAILASALLAISTIATSAATGGGGIPGAASSGTAPRVTIGATSSLVAGVIVNVRVDVVCDPLPSPFDPSIDPAAGHSEGFFVQVVEAVSKKAIAQGETDGFGELLVCDGSAVNSFVIPITTQTVPFTKGAAAAGAEVQICNADCSNFGYRATGPVVIKITK
jgi:hypothetical protein